MGLLVSSFGAGCDTRRAKRTTTSGVFFAPVANESGSQASRVEVVQDPNTHQPINELTILRVINPGKLDSELKNEQAETAVLGKLSNDELLLFERKSSTLMELNFVTGALKLVILKVNNRVVSLSEVFRVAAAKILVSTTLEDPTGGQDHWVVGFETNSRGLFVMNRDPASGDVKVTVVANKTQIQNQIDETTFNLVSALEIPRPAALPGQGRQHELLLTSTRQSLNGQHLYVLRETNGVIQGEFRLFDESGNLVPALDIGFGQEALPYIDFDSMRQVTSSFDLDIFDFVGVPLPIEGENSFLLFDRITNNFIKVKAIRDAASLEIVDRQIELFTQHGEILTAIRQGSTTTDDQALSLNFQSVFFHTGMPLILTFEEETNNLMAIDYNAPFGRRMAIFSSSANVFQRIDLLGTDDEEQGGIREPSFSFSNGDLRENRLVFDRGTNDLLSLNYATGYYVVVLKQRDIGLQTGSIGSSDLTFIEPINTHEIRAFDTQASALITIRVDYKPFPLLITGPPKVN